MDNIINSLETEALHSEALKVYVRLLAANYACFFTVGLLNVSCIKHPPAVSRNKFLKRSDSKLQNFILSSKMLKCSEQVRETVLECNISSSPKATAFT